MERGRDEGFPGTKHEEGCTRGWIAARERATPHTARLRGLFGGDLDLVALQAGGELEPGEAEEGDDTPHCLLAVSGVAVTMTERRVRSSLLGSAQGLAGMVIGLNLLSQLRHELGG